MYLKFKSQLPNPKVIKFSDARIKSLLLKPCGDGEYHGIMKISEDLAFNFYNVSSYGPGIIITPCKEEQFIESEIVLLPHFKRITSEKIENYIVTNEPIEKGFYDLKDGELFEFFEHPCMKLDDKTFFDFTAAEICTFWSDTKVMLLETNKPVEFKIKYETQ